MTVWQYTAGGGEGLPASLPPSVPHTICRALACCAPCRNGQVHAHAVQCRRSCCADHSHCLNQII